MDFWLVRKTNGNAGPLRSLFESLDERIAVEVGSLVSDRIRSGRGDFDLAECVETVFWRW